jgi:hypothetical protein
MYLDAANAKSYNSATSTSTWLDLSGLGNHQTLNVSPTYTGRSFNFNGTGYYTTSTNLVNGLASNSTEFSVGVWFNYTNTVTYTAIFEKQSSIGGAVARMDIGYGGNTFYWTGWNQPTTLVNDLVYTTLINSGTWYYTVLTCTGSLKTAYINDKQVQYALVPTYWPDATNPISGSASKRPTNGQIAALQIYNRALTASEVQQNYNAMRGRFGL